MIPAAGAPVSRLQTIAATRLRDQRPANRPELVHLVEDLVGSNGMVGEGILQNRIAQTSGIAVFTKAAAG